MCETFVAFANIAGIINVHSGVEKLKEIEKSNGVWVQKMTLRVDDEAIVLKTNDKVRNEICINFFQYPTFLNNSETMGEVSQRTTSPSSRLLFVKIEWYL